MTTQSSTLTDRRIFVTGAHGFLGKNVVAELLSRGAACTTPTRLNCDLLNPRDVDRDIQAARPDAVIHLAARVGGIGANRAHPGSFFYENMQMGMNVLESCRRCSVQKVVLVGTVCAYPKYAPVPFREADLWNGYPEETNAPYGIAKKALLVMLQGYREEYGLKGIYLLPVNLFGPGDSLNLETNHVIPALIRRFIVAQRAGFRVVKLWGSGTASREFLFVRDAAKGICDALERYNDPEPCNLGTGRELSIMALAGMIADLAGFTGAIEFDHTSPDGQPRRCLDTSRALAKFGWKATTSLEDGLAETVQWMRSVLPASDIIIDPSSSL